MALSPTAYRFTVKDYHRMAEADIFEPDDRVELIDGEIVAMSAIGTRHAACATRLMHLVLPQLGEPGDRQREAPHPDRRVQRATT